MNFKPTKVEVTKVQLFRVNNFIHELLIIISRKC